MRRTEKPDPQAWPKDLPPGLVKYSESPTFDEHTVPEKILAEHKTKEGVWGVIRVVKGELDYVICGPPFSVQRLDTKTTGIIRPEQLHNVKLCGPVEFKVEFYR